MSSTDVVPGTAAIGRARIRGVCAAVFALLVSVALPFAAMSRSVGSGAALFRMLPTGIVSLLLASALVVASHASTVEWRAPDAVESARPAASRILTGVGILLGLPCAWVSVFFEVLANTAPNCPAPVPVPGGIDNEGLSPGESALLERCEQSTPAEVGGLVTWSVVIAATAALLIVAMVMAKRSRIVGWAAIPTALAGCVIAFDLGHLAALLLR